MHWRMCFSEVSQARVLSPMPERFVLAFGVVLFEIVVNGYVAGLFLRPIGPFQLVK